MENIKTTYVFYKECDKLLNKSVQIINNSVKKYTSYNLIGKTGEIIKTRCTTGSPCILKSIAVKIEGLVNPASDYGLFWINPEDAILLTRKENIMIKNNNLSEGYKLCVVRDITNGRTDVAAYYGKLEMGALVACDYHRPNGKMSVRHVVDLISDTNSNISCEVLGTVDVTAYNAAKTRDEKRKEIFARMEKRASEIEHDMYYKILAEQDEEMAELYKAYCEL